jgi:hypothetical protein
LNVPNELPDLDGATLRPLHDILNRLFCLHALAATAYGFDADRAHTWLCQEQLSQELTQSERSFLQTGRGEHNTFKAQIEGMWALAWAASIVPVIDFWRSCDSNFVNLLPDLRVHEHIDTLADRSTLRPAEEILAAGDLSYCLHWIIRDRLLNGKPPPASLAPYVVIERRRALEWMLSDKLWDQVSLDT